MDFNLRQKEETKPLINVEGLLSTHTELVQARKQSEDTITQNLMAVTAYIKTRINAIAIRESVKIDTTIGETSIIFNIQINLQAQRVLIDKAPFVLQIDQITGEIADQKVITAWMDGNKIPTSTWISVGFSISLLKLTDVILNAIENKLIKTIKVLKHFELKNTLIGIDKETSIISNKYVVPLVTLNTRTKYF